MNGNSGYLYYYIGKASIFYSALCKVQKNYFLFTGRVAPFACGILPLYEEKSSLI